MAEELTVEKIKNATRTIDYCPTLVNEIDGVVIPSNIIIDFLLTELANKERETLMLVSEFIRPQRNDIAATGEEFSNAIIKHFGLVK